MQAAHLQTMFAEDPQRGSRMTVEAVGLFLDYSKNRITDETIRLLVQLAEESGLREGIEAMFRGEKLNVTENRAVLHVARRAPREASIMVDGENVVPKVHAVLDRMTDVFNTASDAVNGRAIRASRSGTSSTSASADRIWGRSWPMRPSSPRASEA